MTALSPSTGRRCRRLLLRFAGSTFVGRVAARLAGLAFSPPHRIWELASIHSRGYISPTAEIVGNGVRIGPHSYIGDRVMLACWTGLESPATTELKASLQADGFLSIGGRTQLHRDSHFEVFAGGFIKVGDDSVVSSGSLLLALVQSISIADRVHVGAYCAFFPYNHQCMPGRPICEQPLDSKGPISVESNVRLGPRVTVLSGVTIGEGANILAGSVVTHDIPPGATAGGAPAKLVA